MDKLTSLLSHALLFADGVVNFVTDHPATTIVGIVGAGTISFATQYTKYAIKVYTNLRRSHWWLLLTSLFTIVGSTITYIATNVRAEDVQYSSWLFATFTGVTIAYKGLVVPVNNFLATYQLVKKPLEDKLKEVADLAEQQDNITAVVATSDKGNDSVVTTVEPPVEAQAATADF